MRISDWSSDVCSSDLERKDRGRGAFQEMNYPNVFGDSAKWVWEVSDTEQLPEVVARGFPLAPGGTPGPIVIVLPEDMLTDTCAPPVPAPNPLPRPPHGRGAPDQRAPVISRTRDVFGNRESGLSDSRGRRII